MIKGEPFSNLEKFQIILLPMMNTTQSKKSKRAYELTINIQQYQDDDIAYYLIGAMAAVNYSHLEEPEKAKILEELKMAKPFEELYRKFELIGEERKKSGNRKKTLKEGHRYRGCCRNYWINRTGNSLIYRKIMFYTADNIQLSRM